MQKVNKQLTHTYMHTCTESLVQIRLLEMRVSRILKLIQGFFSRRIEKTGLISARTPTICLSAEDLHLQGCLGRSLPQYGEENVHSANLLYICVHVSQLKRASPRVLLQHDQVSTSSWAED